MGPEKFMKSKPSRLGRGSKGRLEHPAVWCWQICLNIVLVPCSILYCHEVNVELECSYELIEIAPCIYGPRKHRIRVLEGPQLSF